MAMEYNILVKPGVVFKEFNDHTLKFLTVLKHCCNKFQRSFTITSAADGKHGDNSYHPKNHAWDVRANDCNASLRFAMIAELKANLPVYFDVVLETFELDPSNDHFHVECDLKKLAEGKRLSAGTGNLKTETRTVCEGGEAFPQVV